MSATFLVCACGRRLKIAGATPGRTGRCPACGATVRVPEAEDDEWNWSGTYGLATEPPAAPDAGPSEPSGPDAGDDADEEEPEAPAAAGPGAAVEEDEWDWTGNYALAPEAPPRTPAAPAPAPNLEGEPVARSPGPENPRPARARVRPSGAEPDEAEEPDPWWPPDPSYLFRTAEGPAMAAALGGAGWVLGTLVPEYCLAILADGETMGTPSMGQLIALVSALPAVLVAPMAAIYWLQYLARVLVASADGERRPPRPPDRDLDGLFGGFGAWPVWMLLGPGVASLPAVAYVVAVGDAWDHRVAAGLGLAGVPYALMALLMTFLRDDPLAASPPAVVATLARFAPSFAALCLTVGATLGLAATAFALVYWLRDDWFWVYLPACLPAWLLVAWASIAAMQTLGAYYARNERRLRWRRPRLRWGAG